MADRAAGRCGPQDADHAGPGHWQERALRAAATAAILLTAEELRPDGAEQLPMVISEVFGESVPAAPRARREEVHIVYAPRHGDNSRCCCSTRSAVIYGAVLAQELEYGY